jgi:hypothetical protein
MKNKKLVAICNNQNKGLGNTNSPVQVLAFISLHRAKLRGDMKPFQAFAEAIVQTSDEAFENVDTELLAEYLERNAK